MDKSIVFSKTGKGLLEGRQRSGGLSKELLKLLDLIDGKRALGELRDKLGFVDEKILQTQLRALQEQGLIRRASVPVADAKPLPRPARQQPADDDELDFTSPPTRPIAVVPPAVRASGAAVNSGRPPPAGPAEVIDRSANGPAGVSGRARERSIAKPGEPPVLASTEARAERDREVLAQFAAQTRARAEAQHSAHEQAELGSKQQAELSARPADKTEAGIAAEKRARERAAIAFLEQRKRAKVEEDARKQQAEQEAQRLREQEAEAARRQEEEAQRRREEEAAAAQRQEEEAQRRREEEAAARRQEEEAQRRREEEAAARRQEEEAARRREEEAAAARRQEEEAQRRRQEEEAQRRREEGEAARRREEEAAAARRQEEEAQHRREEEAAAARRQEEEVQRRRKEEAEAARRQEEVQRRREEEAEAARRHEEEAQRRREEEAEAARRQEEEVQRRREEEAAARRHQEEAQRRREEEAKAARRREEAAAAVRHREEEQAHPREEPDVRGSLEGKLARTRQDGEPVRERREEELMSRQQVEEELRKALQAQEQRIKLEEQARLAIAAAEIEAKQRAEREARAQAEAARREQEELDRLAAEEAARRAQEEAARKAKEAEESKRREEEARRKEKVARLTTERRMREEALARQREQQSERDRQAAARKALLEQYKKTPWRRARPVVTVFAMLFVGTVALLEFMPVSFLIPAFEARISHRIGEPVSISDLNMSVLPRLQFRMGGVKLGSRLDVRAKAATAYPAWDSLLGEPLVVERLVVEDLVADAEALPRLITWISGDGGTGDLKLGSVQLQQARILVKGIDLPAFDAALALTARGKIAGGSFSLPDRTLRAELNLAASSFEVSGRGFVLPLGPGIVFDDVLASGSITPDGIRLTGIDGRMYGGRAKGNVSFRWREGWSMAGEFQLQKVQLYSLMQAISKTAKATGEIDADTSFEMKGASIAKLYDVPVVRSTFSISNGSVEGVDLLRVLQSQTRGGMRGGKTRFDFLAGTLMVSNNQFQYRDLKLTSGLFSATGAIDIMPSREVAGRLTLDLKSPSGDYRNSYWVKGNLDSVTLKY